MVFHFFTVPPGADPQHEAAVGDHVEGCNLLGQGDGIALDDQTDTSTEPDGAGGPGTGAERNEGIVAVPVHLRQITAAGERGLAGGRNMGVLGEEQALEAAGFRGLSQLHRLDRVIGGEDGQAESGFVGKSHRGSPLG